MVNEQELCTVIRNSVNGTANSIAWKIPDPTSSFGSATKRPFDLFGTLNGVPFYAEAKYMKTALSFDLQDIEDHQIESLLEVQKSNPSCKCYIILGMKWDRGDTRVYFFPDMKDIALRRKEHRNYLKKDLALLPYISVRKDLLDLSELITHEVPTNPSV